MMTEKHYKMFASAIKTAIDDDGHKVTMFKLCMVLMPIFKRDNPNFDRMKFLEACGLSKETT